MTPKEALVKAEEALRAGNPMAALGFYRSILAKVPKHSVAKRAIRAIEKTSQGGLVTQQDFDQAVQMLQARKFIETEAFLNDLILRDPSLYGLYNVRGLAQSELGKNKEAVASFRKALKIEPGNAEAANNLGLKLKELDELEEAEKILVSLLARQPGYVGARFNLAGVYAASGAYAKAEVAFEDVTRRSPNLALGWLGLGKSQAIRGDRASAKASFETAIDCAPDSFEPYVRRARLMALDKGDKYIPPMIKLADSGELTPLERSQLHFALGEIFENQENYDTSFQHMKVANELQNGLAEYSESRTAYEFASIKKAFQEASNESPPTETVPHPIFIVGMNRSGTSLVEQILASHSKVFGGGEMDAMDRIGESYRNNGYDFSANEASKFAKEYISKSAQLSDLPYVTDKMPANFKWIGLILELFPDAKIVAMQRDAKDLCFSNFKASFESLGHMYSYDQENLARYYLMHADLMAHWRSIYGNRIFTMKYEDLVGSPEENVKALLNYVGLEWEPEVMEFYKSDRAVHTLSQSQVRQKIYSTSIDAWKNYEQHLKPMIDVLKTG